MSSLNDFLKKFEEGKPEDKPKVEEKKNKILLKINKLKTDEQPNQEAQAEEKIPEQKPAKSRRISKSNENSKNDDFYEAMFINSETPIERKEEWFSYIEKAKQSKKRNSFIIKVLNGKFRILQDGKMEMLPEIVTYNKTSKDILKTKWM